MPLKPIRNQAHSFFIELPSLSSIGKFQDNPTLAAGDIVIWHDGVLFGNITTLPSTSSGVSLLTVSLTAAEMDADNVSVVFKDANGNQWSDVTHHIETMVSDVLDVNLKQIDGSLPHVTNFVALIAEHALNGRFNANVTHLEDNTNPVSDLIDLATSFGVNDRIDSNIVSIQGDTAFVSVLNTLLEDIDQDPSYFANVEKVNGSPVLLADFKNATAEIASSVWGALTSSYNAAGSFGQFASQSLKAILHGKASITSNTSFPLTNLTMFNDEANFDEENFIGRTIMYLGSNHGAIRRIIYADSNLGQIDFVTDRPVKEPWSSGDEILIFNHRFNGPSALLYEGSISSWTNKNEFNVQISAGNPYPNSNDWNGYMVVVRDNVKQASATLTDLAVSGSGPWDLRLTFSVGFNVDFAPGAHVEIYAVNPTQLHVQNDLAGTLAIIQSDHASIQADLDNPSQYQADVSGLATSSELSSKLPVFATGLVDPFSLNTSTTTELFLDEIYVVDGLQLNVISGIDSLKGFLLRVKSSGYNQNEFRWITASSYQPATYIRVTLDSPLPEAPSANDPVEIWAIKSASEDIISNAVWQEGTRTLTQSISTSEQAASILALLNTVDSKVDGISGDSRSFDLIVAMLSSFQTDELPILSSKKIIQGDSYSTTLGNAFTWTSYSIPFALDDASNIKLTMYDRHDETADNVEVDATVIKSGVDCLQSFCVEIPSTSTSQLTPGKNRYLFNVQATINNEIFTLVSPRSTITVVKDATDN